MGTFTWKLPRYITYDRNQRNKPYKVAVRHDGKAHYIGNYTNLPEAQAARDMYCGVHNVEIKEKEGYVPKSRRTQAS